MGNQRFLFKTILTETITSKKSGDLGFSLLDYESESKGHSGICLSFVVVACCCGLCVPNKFITTNKRISVVIDLRFHCESESEKKSPDVHL